MSKLPTPSLSPARVDGRVPASLRVTRRGRLLLVLALSALLMAAFSVGRVSSRAAGPRGDGPTRAVVIHPGDTLWSIARRVAPADDPRVVVARLVAANHLGTSTVRPGQRIRIPAP